MEIKCLFGMRVDCTEPELMVAWDEYCVDSNYEGFEEACENAKKSWGKELIMARMVSIQIDPQKLTDAFKTVVMDGKITNIEE